MTDLSATVVVTQSGDEIPSKAVLEGEQHFVVARVDDTNRDIYLSFSTREALYDFAKSLLQEAVFGRGQQKEFFPLVETDGRTLVVDGVRLAAGSSRVFISYS